MKIDVLISGYYRNDTRIWHRQIQSLVKGGHSIRLITNDGFGDDTIGSVKIVDVGQGIKGVFGRIASVFLGFRKAMFNSDADVFIIHSPELLVLPVFARKSSSRFFYDAHEDMRYHLLEKEWLPSFVRLLFSRLWIVFEEHIFSNYIEGLISPHKHIIEHYSSSSRCAVLEVPNYPLLTESRKPMNRTIDIVYSGTAYYYSNQENIIDVIQEIDEVDSYRIAGFIPNDLFVKMNNKDKKMKFEFLGRLSLLELNEILDKSKIGIVYYDYRKNLGWKRGSWGTNKVLEYAAAGLPIICTDFEVWREFIDKNQCGFCITPGDNSALKESITYLLNNPERAHEMGARARKAVAEFYNWSRIEYEFTSFIENKISE